jgi:hypothetical protein
MGSGCGRVESLAPGRTLLERTGRLRLPDSEDEADPQRFHHLTGPLYRKPWVVYAKRPFGGPEQVLRYLGRYTHRVGLSNRRLVSLDERGVTLRTKSGKTVTLEPLAFLGRFIEHILPAGFVKIRHSGLLAPRHVSTLFARSRAVLQTASTTSPAPTQLPSPGDYQSLLLALTGLDTRLCPACGGCTLERRPLPAARAPPGKAA